VCDSGSTSRDSPPSLSSNRPLVVDFDVRVSLSDPGPLYEEILAWAEVHRQHTLAAGASIPKAYESLGAGTITTAALESDTRITGFLRRSGYVSGDRHEVRYSLDLTNWEPPPPPPSPLRVPFRHRHDLDERVDLHRDACPSGPSQFSRAAYERIRSTPAYDQALDLVLTDETGQLLSYCIAWADRILASACSNLSGTARSWRARVSAIRNHGRSSPHEERSRIRRSSARPSVNQAARIRL